MSGIDTSVPIPPQFVVQDEQAQVPPPTPAMSVVQGAEKQAATTIVPTENEDDDINVCARAIWDAASKNNIPVLESLLLAEQNKSKKRESVINWKNPMDELSFKVGRKKSRVV